MQADECGAEEAELRVEEAESSLLLSESLCFFDGISQLFDKLFKALVGRQVEAIETRVAPWQPRVLADLFDAEMLWTVAPHQFGKSSDWKATCSGDEL